MAVPKDFIAYVQELLAPLGAVRVRPMFGAAGVYLDDVFFAVMDEDSLYFRVDEQTEAAFRAAGSGPFVYQEKDGRTIEMAYWRAPAEAMDSPEAAEPWARLGLDAALRKAREEEAEEGGSLSGFRVGVLDGRRGDAVSAAALGGVEGGVGAVHHADRALARAPFGEARRDGDLAQVIGRGAPL